MIKPLHIAFLFLLPAFLYSQSPEAVSTIDSLCREAWNHRYEQPEQAMRWSEAAREQAAAVGYDKGEADALSRIGALHFNAGDYEQALDYHTQSLKLREANNWQDGMAKSYLNIGSVHLAMGNYAEAEGYFMQSHDLRQDYHPVVDLGKSWSKLGDLYAMQGELKKADSCYEEAQTIFEENNNATDLAIVLNNRANVFWEEDRLDSAIACYAAAQLLHRNNQNWQGMASSLSNKSLIFIEQGKFAEADQALHRALRISDSIQAREVQLDVLYNLYWLADTMGDPKRALTFYERFDSLESEVQSQDKQEAILRLEAIYQNAKKEIENNALRAESERVAAERRFALWIAFLLLLGSVGVWLWFNQRAKQKEALAAERQRLKQREIDDLLQKQELLTLNAKLEGQDRERKRIAQDLHDRVGSQLAALKLSMELQEKKLAQGLEQSEKQFSQTYNLLDSLVDEVREISHNMVSSVLMRFGLEAALKELADRLRTDQLIDIAVLAHNLDQRIGTEIESALYRIAQELVANTLKHAQAQSISIGINKMDQSVNMVYEDDGIGFDPQAVVGGIGLKGVESRVAALNGKFQIDTGKGRGTTIIIDIPLNQ